MPHPTTPAAAPRLLFDRLGVTASVVCLVHCLALPFVLTALAGFSTAAHEVFHLAVALVTLPLALAAARPGLREHGDHRVLSLLGAGATAFVAGLLLHDAVPEATVVVLSVLGSALLVGGHTLNFRLRRRCAHHAAPHHAGHCD